MKFILCIFITILTQTLFAQDEGFFSRNDMNRQEPRHSFGSGKERSASISLGDINNDGKLDAVVANGRHWPGENLIFFNYGKGFNSEVALGNANSTSYAAELVDLDNDGDLDILEINDNAPHKIFVNDGIGNYTFHSEVAKISNARNVSLGDLDNDGYADFIITNRGQKNMICYNQGDLKFECTPLETEQNSTIDIAIKDLNKDGFLDLVLANRDNIPNEIFIGKGNRQFEKKLEFGSGSFESRSVSIADVDNDGYLDLITGNINNANTVYFGDKDFTYRRTTVFGDDDADTYAIALADFNKDGFIDIVTANYRKPNIVFMNIDGTSFKEIQLTEMAARTYDVVVGDINGDGWMDIAVANSDDFNLYYLNIFHRE